MTDLVQEYTDLDFLTIGSDEDAVKAAQDLRVNLAPGTKWGEAVAAVFEAHVEKELIGPIHVTDIPLDVSPLAQPKNDDPRLTERFETYVNGWEIANAFSELNGPFDQYARFRAQEAQRIGGDNEAHPFDEDFVETLEFGMPPTGGMGIGIDRLVMLLTDSKSIRDVIAFPTMRPAGADSLIRKLDEQGLLGPDEPT